MADIDFIRLCRRANLPPPRQQSIRVVDGRRRNLDAEWLRADGTRVVAEVDGAQHLTPEHWLDDMDRQNEIMLDGTVVAAPYPGRCASTLLGASGILPGPWTCHPRSCQWIRATRDAKPLTR